ncbi:MAG: hypothetical protein ABI162_11365 [Luteolibacter sp.]
MAAIASLHGEISVLPEEFASLSLDEALKISNHTTGGDRSTAYARAAVNSKRMDLIRACFTSSVTYWYIREAVAELPESPYKDSLTLMMLETRSAFWPYNYERSGSFAVVIEIDQEPFGSFIKKWLPDRKFNKETTPETRQQLADEIRAAMANAENPQPPVTRSNKHPSRTISESGIAKEEIPTPVTQAEKPQTIGKQSSQGSRWLWIIAAILTGIFGARWLIKGAR